MDFLTLERVSRLWPYDERFLHKLKEEFMKFGSQIPIGEVFLWFKKTGHEALLLSTNDAEFTQACIDQGADPHANNDRALSFTAEDGDNGKVATLEVLLKYKPSLQALENALNCTRKFSWSSNPVTEAILKKHIEVAKNESSEDRAKPVPKINYRIVMGINVA